MLEYDEHDKRVWCVHFSTARSAIFASGGDDGVVKVGSSTSFAKESSLMNDCGLQVFSSEMVQPTLSLGVGANICSVRFSPFSECVIPNPEGTQ